MSKSDDKPFRQDDRSIEFLTGEVFVFINPRRMSRGTSQLVEQYEGSFFHLTLQVLECEIVIEGRARIDKKEDVLFDACVQDSSATAIWAS